MAPSSTLSPSAELDRFRSRPQDPADVVYLWQTAGLTVMGEAYPKELKGSPTAATCYTERHRGASSKQQDRKG